MRKNISISIFILLTIFTYCQAQKTIDIPTYKNGDTTYCYKWTENLRGQLKLKKITNSNDTFHFRFWQSGQALDIWTIDYKTFQGTVTNFIKKYNPSKRNKKTSKPDKVITDQIILDTTQANHAYRLIVENSILTIPSEEKITGWNQGRDGIIYVIEISTQDKYIFKSYWTPTAQDSLPEAKQIQRFVERINTKLNLGKLYENFISLLPDGTYTTDYFIMISIGTINENIFDTDNVNDSENDNVYY